MKTIHNITGVLLIIVAIGISILSFSIEATDLMSGLIKILLLVAAADMVSTVIFKKPLIKGYGIAKFMYGKDINK